MPTPSVMRTINQVADQLGLSRRSVQYLVDSGQLRAKALSPIQGQGLRPRVRVSQAEVERYLSRQADKGAKR